MNGRCAACGAEALVPYMRVRHAGGADLIPTTDHYGEAPADLVRCAVCGHRQVERFPDEADLAAAYARAEDLAYVEEEAGERATAAAALERIERHVVPGAICDVGCWVGFLLSEAGRRGWRAAGVEPSRFASSYARERLGLNVVTGALDSGPDGPFDAVVMADLIEHMPDPGHALDRAAALLSEGGVLYLALPDAGSAVARALGRRWWSVVPTHVQYFTRGSMRRLLERHGFRVEWMDTAPKSFSVRYYLGRLHGYSPRLARALVGAAERTGLADRIVTPDFRDRMAVVARRGQAPGGA